MCMLLRLGFSWESPMPAGAGTTRHENPEGATKQKGRRVQKVVISLVLRARMGV